MPAVSCCNLVFELVTPRAWPIPRFGSEVDILGFVSFPCTDTTCVTAIALSRMRLGIPIPLAPQAMRNTLRVDASCLPFYLPTDAVAALCAAKKIISC